MEDTLETKSAGPSATPDQMGGDLNDAASISFDHSADAPVTAQDADRADATAPTGDDTPTMTDTPPATAPTAESPAPTTGRQIMVVEDDMFISDIYDVKLTSAGYDVILANNGRDAIEKLTAGARPHLMLLDIVMPYMDGFDVLDAFAGNPQWQKIPIVLLTNLSQKEDIDRAIKGGAKDYLIKSHFTPSEVLSKVEKYILKD